MGSTGRVMALDPASGAVQWEFRTVPRSGQWICQQRIPGALGEAGGQVAEIPVALERPRAATDPELLGVRERALEALRP